MNLKDLEKELFPKLRTRIWLKIRYYLWEKWLSKAKEEE